MHKRRRRFILFTASEKNEDMPLFIKGIKAFLKANKTIIPRRKFAYFLRKKQTVFTDDFYRKNATKNYGGKYNF